MSNIVINGNNIIDLDIINEIYINIIFSNDIMTMCKNFTKDDLTIIFSYPEEIISLMLKNLSSIKCNIVSFTASPKLIWTEQSVLKF
jgi:hypothetical protein